MLAYNTGTNKYMPAHEMSEELIARRMKQLAAITQNVDALQILEKSFVRLCFAQIEVLIVRLLMT